MADNRPSSSHSKDGFTEAQICEITNIVAQTIVATKQEGNFLNDHANLRASHALSAPASLRNEDIGFFDLDIEDNSLGLVASGRYLIYKNVYAFTDRRVSDPVTSCTETNADCFAMRHIGFLQFS